jgi:hypothetical protein
MHKRLLIFYADSSHLSNIVAGQEDVFMGDAFWSVWQPKVGALGLWPADGLSDFINSSQSRQSADTFPHYDEDSKQPPHPFHSRR